MDVELELVVAAISVASSWSAARAVLDAISLTDCSTVCCTIDWICANCGLVSNAEDNSAGGGI